MGGKLSLKDILDNLMDLFLLKNGTQSENLESKPEKIKNTGSVFRDETLYIGDVVIA